MAGTTITNDMRKIMLTRAYTENGDLSSTQYLPPTRFRVGINQADPEQSDTGLTQVIPITRGTVCDDGDNQLTGSNGGSNTTDNTTTYKPGARVYDDTAQNLIKTTGNATATWTISNLATNGTNIDGTEPYALWLYIKDAAALAKLKSSGTCLEIKLGSDTSNYYSDTYEASGLAVGWNWITSGTSNVEDLSETGTVSGDIDTFIIEVTTNDADDEFAAGDLVYDLLRQWAETDTVKDLVDGYPLIDVSNYKVTMRAFLSSIEANGFDINGQAEVNEDSSELTTGITKPIAESKADTDEFAFINVDLLI